MSVTGADFPQGRVVDAAQRGLAALWTRGGGPTPDLYFRNACAEALLPHGAGSVDVLSPSVFATEKAVLVMRHSGGAALSPGVIGGRKLIWFCDDAVLCANATMSLSYRAKLMMTDAWAGRRIGAQADHIVLSTDALRSMARYLAPSAPVSVLHPYWAEQANPLDQFDAPGVVEIAYLGAATHRADFSFLAPVMEAVLAARPQARFHVTSNHRAPRGLRRHDRVLSPMRTTWPDWRSSLASRRYHILLYPLTGSRFNRGRSINKLIEHGLTGGASLYSAEWEEARQIGDAGLTLPTQHQAWVEAIINLVDDIGGRGRQLAVAGQKLAADLNDPRPQRALWNDLMGLSLSEK